VIGSEGLKSGIKASDLSNVSRQGRLAIIKAAKGDRSEFKKTKRRGGSTNKEKNRKKPIMMSMNSLSNKTKKFLRSKDKLESLQKHVKTLRRQANSGGKTKRRRR
jgi:hypothetical protein